MLMDFEINFFKLQDIPFDKTLCMSTKLPNKKDLYCSNNRCRKVIWSCVRVSNRFINDHRTEREKCVSLRERMYAGYFREFPGISIN